MGYKLRIFTDFDGTVTFKDIGDELFKKFGEFEPYHTLLLERSIDIKTYWYKICKTLDPKLDYGTLEKYALTFETDPYFVTFAEYCQKEGYPLSIVSDGFDVYIYPILRKLGLNGLDVYCNRLILKEGEPAYPVFPGASESCNCLSASCKRNALLKELADDEIIVFIGDGYSDYCAAEHADVIFAKKSLAAYCNKNRIPHYPFSNFFDVYRLLQDAIKKNKIRVRHQAKLARNKAWETE